MQEMRIYGKSYPVTGVTRETLKGKEIVMPIVDLGLLTDYEWFLGCLKSRLTEPELYDADDDGIEKMKKCISDLTTKELYAKFFAKYKICYDFVFGCRIEKKEIV